MKIKRDNVCVVEFGELIIGDVFEFCSDLYLKVDNASAGNNAFDLVNNTLGSFGTFEEVIKLQAELSVW